MNSTKLSVPNSRLISSIASKRRPFVGDAASYRKLAAPFASQRSSPRARRRAPALSGDSALPYADGLHACNIAASGPSVQPIEIRRNTRGGGFTARPSLAVLSNRLPRSVIWEPIRCFPYGQVMKTTIEISDPLLRDARKLPGAKGSRCARWWNGGFARRRRDAARPALQVAQSELQGPRPAGPLLGDASPDKLRDLT